MLLLQQGDLLVGFKEYDYRPCSHADRSRWNGKRFVGKQLLVFDEQGFGDVLQFVRYLPAVKKLGGRVTFATRRYLFDLLREFPGIDELVERDNVIAEHYDSVVPLMTLPRLMRTTLSTIPNQVPYLHADPGKAAHWKRRFSQSGVKVGIVWAGNPKHPRDKTRSCTLRDFLPLLGVRGVRFYSLQFGKAMKQLETLPHGTRLENVGGELRDFSQMAAVMQNLDLVISVDTAAVHLAGAMGKPVFNILAADSDWRWMLDRSDSPWYPTMRLFRQAQHEDKTRVFAEVRRALRRFAAADRPTISRDANSGITARDA
jgi:hypothetical protein